MLPHLLHFFGIGIKILPRHFRSSVQGSISLPTNKRQPRWFNCDSDRGESVFNGRSPDCHEPDEGGAHDMTL